MLLFIPLGMFLPAGTWAWTRGWLFVLVYFGSLVGGCSTISGESIPELFRCPD